MDDSIEHDSCKKAYPFLLLVHEQAALVDVLLTQQSCPLLGTLAREGTRGVDARCSISAGVLSKNKVEIVSVRDQQSHPATQTGLSQDEDQHSVTNDHYGLA